MKIIKAETEKRGWRGRKRKGIPKGERGPCVSEKKGGKKRKAQDVRFLEGGVSRRSGSGGGGPARDPNGGVHGGTYPSSTTRVEGYDLRDVEVGRGDRQLYQAPTKRTAPPRGLCAKQRSWLPSPCERSRHRTFTLVSRIPRYLSIAGEPHLENSTLRATPRSRLPFWGRAKTARIVVRIQGPCCSQQVSAFAITAYLPWSICKSGALVVLRPARLESQAWTESHSGGRHRGKIPR